MKAAAALLALAAPTLTPTPVAAEALEDFMSGFEARGAAYGYTRCAGFYGAILDRATEAEFGAEGMATLTRFADDTLRAAVTAEAEANAAGMSGAALVVRTDMLRFRQVYGARFEQNYMTRGAILREDAQLAEDNTICRQLAQRAAGATEEATQ